MINSDKQTKGPYKPLSVFSLVMINVIAVDSLRNLAVSAEYGLALVFFYLLAALLFFIPTILVTAELATGWPITGGSYVWVKEAFGPRVGFLAIWLQWIYNVIWYPTIFAFIAGILAYLIHPDWVDNKTYMLIVILSLFWGMTLINCIGIKISSFISTIGAIFGTILPMLLISGLGIFWVVSRYTSHIQFSFKYMIPGQVSFNNLAFITNILFSLMGMEMSAIHAGDVRHPARDYPQALLYSMIIILTTLIFASLAIAIVLPLNQLNLVSGLIDAFAIFFKAYHLNWLTPLIAVLIIMGSLSCAAAWIIGPARALFVAGSDHDFPQFLKKTNTKDVPLGILITQAFIVTGLCTILFILPSVKSSYWLLSNLTAQLALIFYVLLFASALRLHYKCIHIKRAFKIPGGIVGIWLVCSLAILTCIIAIFLGFLPPSQVEVGKTTHYELILILGIIICCLLPIILFRKKKITD